MTIVYAFIFDKLYFHEALNKIEIVATLIILITALGVAYFKISHQNLETI